MSPINTLSILGFASAALAVPRHGHPMHHHGGRPSGFSAFPYPSANGTVIGSTGTAAPTNYAPQPVGPATESAVASESATTIVEPSTYFNAASGTICTTDVTVTSKVQVTVTVTLPEESATSSSEAAAVSTSASSTRSKSTLYLTSTVTNRHTTTAAGSSSAASAVESSAASSVASSSSSSSIASSTAPITSSSSSSVEVAPVTTGSSYSSAESTSSAAPSISMTYSEANKAPAYTSSSSSSSAAPTQSSSYGGSSGSGKRGVSYNDASLTECFMNNPQITWGFNWGSSSSGLSTSVNYIPQLWSSSNTFTDSWSSNAKSAIKSGSTHLFSFNEPDLSSQANMSPEDAAAAYKTYMEPFAGQAKLCAPAVTNGGGSMGLTWLQNFMDACTDCTIDCVNVHWYDSAENTDYFKSHVSNATQISGGKPVFVSEFGATGSDDQIGDFLGTVMDWMDGESSVAGYAYFMVSDGLLVSGGEPSGYGKVYAGSS